MTWHIQIDKHTKEIVTNSSIFVRGNTPIPSSHIIRVYEFFIWSILMACSCTYVRFPLGMISSIFFVRINEHAELVSNWVKAKTIRLNPAQMRAIVMSSYYYINELAAIKITGMNFGYKNKIKIHMQCEVWILYY